MGYYDKFLEEARTAYSNKLRQDEPIGFIGIGFLASVFIILLAFIVSFYFIVSCGNSSMDALSHMTAEDAALYELTNDTYYSANHIGDPTLISSAYSGSSNDTKTVTYKFNDLKGKTHTASIVEHIAYWEGIPKGYNFWVPYGNGMWKDTIYYDLSGV